MKAFPVHIALLAVAAILALAAAVSTVAAAEAPAELPARAAAFQDEEEGGTADDGSGVDVVPVAVWTTVGVLGGAVVFGVLYMLKKRLGGFPANPSWVAPITIMPSKDFPDETTYGGDDAHGHGHGHGAPAGH
ncbi:MAG: hypothetical protein IT303_18030 [Dehalococcoidia bacterium]|nr:hypothetical protein [Dehalococcoidia bacterium]